MPAPYLLIILLTALPVLIGLYFLWRYLREEVLDPSGKSAPGRTGRILARYALPRRFRLLRSLRLPLEDGSFAVAENVLVGFFGIFTVHTLGARGEFYGQPGGKEWTLVQEDRRTVFPNPLREQDAVMRAIRGILSKNKVYNVPMERAVVFSNRSKKTIVYIPSGEEIILGGRLSSYLDRARFDNDAEIDPDKIAALLSPYAEKQG